MAALGKHVNILAVQSPCSARRVTSPYTHNYCIPPEQLTSCTRVHQTLFLFEIKGCGLRDYMVSCSPFHACIGSVIFRFCVYSSLYTAHAPLDNRSHSCQPCIQFWLGQSQCLTSCPSRAVQAVGGAQICMYSTEYYRLC